MPVQTKVPSGDILSIDIGGTNLKACILSPQGKLLTDFKKIPTPKNSTPEAVLDCLKVLTKDLLYDYISGKFSNFALCLSEVNTNPVRYFF